jgi:hypothetical protein
MVNGINDAAIAALTHNNMDAGQVMILVAAFIVLHAPAIEQALDIIVTFIWPALIYLVRRAFAIIADKIIENLLILLLLWLAGIPTLEFIASLILSLFK